MNTIKIMTDNILYIKKSSFITHVFPIENEDDAKTLLQQLKDIYPDANHHCYAYIINNTKRYCDDKEPSGTAGLPILNMLEKHDLTNVLCIVTRYFGGIKLGAPGLTRSYRSSVKEALKKTEIIPYHEYIYDTITFSYEKEKQILYLLNKEDIIKKEYHTFITYHIRFKKEDIVLIQKLKTFTK